MSMNINVPSALPTEDRAQAMSSLERAWAAMVGAYENGMERSMSEEEQLLAMDRQRFLSDLARLPPHRQMIRLELMMGGEGPLSQLAASKHKELTIKIERMAELRTQLEKLNKEEGKAWAKIASGQAVLAVGSCLIAKGKAVMALAGLTGNPFLLAKGVAMLASGVAMKAAGGATAIAGAAKMAQVAEQKGNVVAEMNLLVSEIGMDSSGQTQPNALGNAWAEMNLVASHKGDELAQLIEMEDRIRAQANQMRDQLAAIRVH